MSMKASEVWCDDCATTFVSYDGQEAAQALHDGYHFDRIARREAKADRMHQLGVAGVLEGFFDTTEATEYLDRDGRVTWAEWHAFMDGVILGCELRADLAV